MYILNYKNTKEKKTQLMSEKNKSIIKFIMPLIVFSIILYTIHAIIFRNPINTFSGIMLSLAYVPIGISYQRMVVDKLLDAKEKESAAKKMNLVMSSFYNSIGNDIIGYIAKGDIKLNARQPKLGIFSKTNEASFENIIEFFKDYECELDIDKIKLDKIYKILEEKDDMMLSLITNEAIDGYSGIIDMLTAMLHVKDELTMKFEDNGFDFSSKEAKAHLTKDIARCYTLLMHQWIAYMADMKIIYPTRFKNMLKVYYFK